MNEELRARAIEAAARAQEAYWDLDHSQTEDFDAKALAVEVDAVLCVVADWCDEQADRNSMWALAFLDVAGAACRPAGEET